MGAAIMAETLRAQRVARSEKAQWTDPAVDDEKQVIGRTAAAVLETNAVVRGDREWTKGEVAGMATDVLGLATVERACGFVGHCGPTGR